MKTFKLLLFGLAVAAFAVFALANHSPGIVLGAFLALCLVSNLLAKQQAACFLVTLSVPELLMDVMDAFRLELFPLKFFSTDHSSATAVLNDKITAHVATIPTTAAYDATTGFANGATAAENLLVDVPVTLDTLRHCPVVVKFLSQIASKMPLYLECTRNTGYALAKYVLDAAMAKVVAANFTHSEPISSVNFTLDALETLRTDLNTQKAKAMGRFGIINSTYATALQNDDRVKSALFYAQLNGDRGYRVFRNIAGFEAVIEYPDLPTNSENLAGFFGDSRSIVIATRQIVFANAANQLKVPQIMEFIPMTDPETELTMTGVGWQQPGTGDVTFSPAVLFGIGAGAQGGTAGTVTDNAGLRLTTQ